MRAVSDFLSLISGLSCMIPTQSMNIFQNTQRKYFNMEEQEYDNPDQAFQEGFNSGYILAEHDPKLLEKILWERESDHDQLTNGLIWGKKQFEQELNKEQLKEFGRIRNKGKERDKI